MHDIAVLHDVVLAFNTQFTRLFRALLAIIIDKILIGDGFGADKAFFEIGMDDCRRFWCSCADSDGPGADFFTPAVK